MRPNGCRLVLLIAPALLVLLPLACVVIILERVTQILFKNQLDRNFSSRTAAGFSTTLSVPNATSGDATQALPVDLNVGPPLAILGVSIIAAFVAFVAACGVWDLRRVEGSATAQRAWVWAIVLADLVVVGLSIGVLAWTSAVQHREAWNSVEDGMAAEGAPKPFTRETWACEIDVHYPQQDWAGPVCGLARATRYMLIPIIFAAVLVIVSAYILARDRGGLPWLFGGKGRYAGFDSTFEMNSSYGAAPTSAYQPSSQQYPAYTVQAYPSQGYPPPFPGPHSQYYQHPIAQSAHAGAQIPQVSTGTTLQAQKGVPAEGDPTMFR